MQILSRYISCFTWLQSMVKSETIVNGFVVFYYIIVVVYFYFLFLPLPVWFSAQLTDCKMVRTDRFCSERHKEGFFCSDLVDVQFPLAIYLNSHRIFIYYILNVRGLDHTAKAKQSALSFLDFLLLYFFPFTVPLLPHLITLSTISTSLFSPLQFPGIQWTQSVFLLIETELSTWTMRCEWLGD